MPKQESILRKCYVKEIRLINMYIPPPQQDLVKQKIYINVFSLGR